MLRAKHRVILAGCVLTASLAWGQGGFEGPGTYEIRSVRTGRVLDLDRNDHVTLVQEDAHGTPSQMWQISPAGPGYYYITNIETGRALEFVQDKNGSPVVAQNVTAQNPNQSWLIEPRGVGVWMVTRFRRALDVPGGDGRDGLRLQIFRRNGDSNQQYTMRRVEPPREQRYDRDDRRDGDDRRGRDRDRRDGDRRDDDRRDNDRRDNDR